MAGGPAGAQLATPPGSRAGMSAADREFQALRARLTSGGYNAGIVSEPAHPGRTFQIAICPTGPPYLDPGDCPAEVPRPGGAWWPAWEAWLAQHCSGREAPPAMGAPGRGYPPLDDALWHVGPAR